MKGQVRDYFSPGLWTIYPLCKLGITVRIYTWLYLLDTDTSLSIPRKGMLLQQNSTAWEWIAHFQSPPARVGKQLLTALSLLLVNVFSLHPFVEIPCIQGVSQGKFNNFPPPLELWFSYSYFFFPTSQNSSLIGLHSVFTGIRFSKQGTQCIHAIYFTKSTITLWDPFYSSSPFQIEQTFQHPHHTLTSALTSDTNQSTTTISPLRCWRKKKENTYNAREFFH